jgi:hypothetical protein
MLGSLANAVLQRLGIGNAEPEEQPGWHGLGIGNPEPNGPADAGNADESDEVYILPVCLCITVEGLTDVVHLCRLTMVG